MLTVVEPNTPDDSVTFASAEPNKLIEVVVPGVAVVVGVFMLVVRPNKLPVAAVVVTNPLD